MSSSIYGKISVAIYYFILIFGGMTTVFGMVAPIQSADCMATPFLKHEHSDEIVWFKAMGRMCGALATLFLIAVYMLGHSTKSLILLLLWGLLNYLNFAVMIPLDFREGGSEEAEACMRYMRVQVGGFAVLEAIAVLLSCLDDAQTKRTGSYEESLIASD